MDRRKRMIFVMLVAVIGGVLIFYQSLSDKTPRGDRELEALVDRFMTTLPDTTTADERDEIQGIMDRFYNSAVRGNVAAEDVIAIENDLRGYVEKGEIQAEELFPFMSKVGKATRRGAGTGGEPKG
jgi:hypothetical protein